MDSGASTKIYYANSYHKDFFWTKWIVDGFESVLIKEGYKLETKHGFLNAFTENKSSKEKLGRKIIDEIKKYDPDLVVCTDDDAMLNVCQYIKDRNVLFNGINGIHKYIKSGHIDSIEKPGHNITGVFQIAYWKESLSLIKKLYPKAKTFSVIKDKTTTSNELYSELKSKLNSLPLKLKRVVESNKFEKWKQELKKMSKETDVLFILNANSIVGIKGNAIEYTEVYKWIGNNILKPTIGTWQGPVENGILLSASDDGPNQGIFTAYQAIKILKGAKPGDIKIMPPPNGVPIINMKTARKLKLRIKQEHMNIFIDNGKIYEP
jgi:ABC-type uncharacterized transport system substrate-binding protein